jgi:hypothetical protein
MNFDANECMKLIVEDKTNLTFAEYTPVFSYYYYLVNSMTSLTSVHVTQLHIELLMYDSTLSNCGGFMPLDLLYLPGRPQPLLPDSP